MNAVVGDFEERLRDTERQTLENRLNLNSHEKECSLRYAHVRETMAQAKDEIAGMRNDAKRFVAAGVGIALLVIGFLIKLVFFS